MNTVAAHETLERRLAARALLRTPMMKNTDHAEELALVRRHAKTLREIFFSRFGYVLTVETGFARLQKHPLPASSAPRPAHRSTGQPFSPRTYTYLALVCSALLSGNTGEQTLLTSLVEQVKADAVTAGIALEESGAHARDLVQALYLLVEWGVISETEGTVAAWGSRHEEALLDVHRPLLPLLLAHPLRDASSPADMLDGPTPPSGGGEEPRRSLRRKLVESPVVLRAHMTDAERGVLSRERRTLEDVFAGDFGLVLEVRAEGALVYDPAGEVTDVVFPGRGTVPHAALLLTNALIDVLDPKATDVVADTRPLAFAAPTEPTVQPAADEDTGEGKKVNECGDPGEGGPGPEADATTAPPVRSLPGKLAPWPVVEENIDLLIEQYGGTFGAGYVVDPALLRDAIVDLLYSVELAHPTDDGLVLSPACARYRPEPQRSPARTRAVRRLHPGTDDDQLPLETEHPSDQEDQ